MDVVFFIGNSSHSNAPSTPIKKNGKTFSFLFSIYRSTAAKRKREQWLPSEEEQFFDSLRILRSAGEGDDRRGGVTAISTAISRAIGTKDVDQVRARARDANREKTLKVFFFKRSFARKFFPLSSLFSFFSSTSSPRS